MEGRTEGKRLDDHWNNSGIKHIVSQMVLLIFVDCDVVGRQVDIHLRLVNEQHKPSFLAYE